MFVSLGVTKSFTLKISLRLLQKKRNSFIFLRIGNVKPFFAHDLVWIDTAQSLSGPIENWVKENWSATLPLVVRRDKDALHHRIPVGIRGANRSQRCALWVGSNHIVRKVTPQEALEFVKTTSFKTHPISAVREFIKKRWPFEWGVTGSCAYSLVTNICVMRKESDLDLVVRSSQELSREDFKTWFNLSMNCPCQVDTQIDTGSGAFSLKEWMRSKEVLLKTDTGPRIVSNPWEK